MSGMPPSEVVDGGLGRPSLSPVVVVNGVHGESSPRRAAAAARKRRAGLVRNGGGSNPSTPRTPLTPRFHGDLDDEANNHHHYSSTSLAGLGKHVQAAKLDLAAVRHEVVDLQGYASAKMSRMERYLEYAMQAAVSQAEEIHEAYKVRLEGSERERQRLFNDLLQRNGNIRVFCRIRPIRGPDEQKSSIACSCLDEQTVNLSAAPGSPAYLNHQRKEFDLDRAYGPQSTQAEIFGDVQPLMQSLVDGYNVCIFAYGQTGSGKTYTMEGPPEDRGVYYNAVKELFRLVNASADPEAFSFSVYMLEIYNEQLYDLLVPKQNTKEKLDIVGILDTVEVAGLSTVKVSTPEEFHKVFATGSASRAVGQTRSNDRSSRSHLVMGVLVHRKLANGLAETSKLSLVDMAGSERLGKSEATGDRLTESLHINKSLSALGDVISALLAKKPHVPYRNSKLTHLLSDSLGGDSKTCMLVTVSPTFNDRDETAQSLSFASRARNTELNQANRDSLKQLRTQNQTMKRELQEKHDKLNETSQQLMAKEAKLEQAERQRIALASEMDHARQLLHELGQAVVERDTRIEALEQQLQATQETCDMLDEESRNAVNRLKREMAEKVDEVQLALNARDSEIAQLKIKLRSAEGHLQRTSSANLLASLPAEVPVQRRWTNPGITSEQKASDAAPEASRREETSKAFMRERGQQNGSLHGEGQAEQHGQWQASRSSSFAEGRSMAGASTSAAADQLSLMLLAAESTGRPSESGSPSSVSGEHAHMSAKYVQMVNELCHKMDEAAEEQHANQLLSQVLEFVSTSGASSGESITLLHKVNPHLTRLIQRMQAEAAIDTRLVSRVRILYIRDLLRRAPSLAATTPSFPEEFLEKGPSRDTTPVGTPNSSRHGKLMNATSNKRDGTVTLDLKRVSNSMKMKWFLRSVGKGQWGSSAYRQRLTLQEIEVARADARLAALGNRQLAMLLAHRDHSTVVTRICDWVRRSFTHLDKPGSSAVASEVVEQIADAILDGWMDGLSTPQGMEGTALEALLVEYLLAVHKQKLDDLEAVAHQLATESLKTVQDVQKLRTEFEVVEEKRVTALAELNAEPMLMHATHKPTFPAVGAITRERNVIMRSLAALESVMLGAEEVRLLLRSPLFHPSRRHDLHARLDALMNENKGSMRAKDRTSAERYVDNVHLAIEAFVGSSHSSNASPSHLDDNNSNYSSPAKSQGSSGFESPPSANAHARARVMSAPMPDVHAAVRSSITEWVEVKFNVGSGANMTALVVQASCDQGELIVRLPAKAGGQGQDEKVISVMPKPEALDNLSVTEIDARLNQLPISLCSMAMARTADMTRMRYRRLYEALAARVPALSYKPARRSNSVGDLMSNNNNNGSGNSKQSLALANGKDHLRQQQQQQQLLKQQHSRLVEPKRSTSVPRNGGARTLNGVTASGAAAVGVRRSAGSDSLRSTQRVQYVSDAEQEQVMFNVPAVEGFQLRL